MRAPASLPLFGDAYMADTRHLSLAEHGAYLLLMMIAWRSERCELPDDDRRLASMLGLTAAKWAAMKPTIMAFWSRTETGWQQKRLAKERVFVDGKIAKNVRAAETRWADKPMKTNKPADAPADASAMQTECPYPPTHLPSGSNTKRIPQSSRATSVPSGPVQTRPDDNRAPSTAAEIMRLAGMITPPRDFHLAADWLKAGADPVEHIYPVVERLSAAVHARGQTVSSFGYFAREIEAARTADDREVAAYAERIGKLGDPSVEDELRQGAEAQRRAEDEARTRRAA